MVTKLCSGQEILYKINQRGIIKNRNKVELWKRDNADADTDMDATNQSNTYMSRHKKHTVFW